VSAIKVPWKEPEKPGPTRQQEAHADLVLMRLHALIQAGYRPQLGAEAGGASQIDFTHPNAQPLTLWPDGMVLDEAPTTIHYDNQRTVIYHDDALVFARFIASVPRPNILHRIWRTSVANLFGYSMICAVMSAPVLAIAHHYHQTRWAFLLLAVYFAMWWRNEEMEAAQHRQSLAGRLTRL